MFLNAIVFLVKVHTHTHTHTTLTIKQSLSVARSGTATLLGLTCRVLNSFEFFHSGTFCPIRFFFVSRCLIFVGANEFGEKIGRLSHLMLDDRSLVFPFCSLIFGWKTGWVFVQGYNFTSLWDYGFIILVLSLLSLWLCMFI